MSVDDEIHLHLCPDRVTWREVDDDVVALDVRRAEYLSFNDTGAELWMGLAEPTTVTELATLIVDHYGIDRDRAQHDVQMFIYELVERELVERL